MQTGARVALAGMIVNVLLAAAKVTAGLLGNSYVLIADGIESVLDIGGSAVIWGGLKFASRPPDATHPYGHGKAEPLAAGIVAVGVLLAALGLAIQSAREIFLPHHAPAPFTLIVLIVVVAVKEFLYRSVIRLGKNVESTAVQTDAWHHRADAMTSIAAFIGISVALIGGERWHSADAWAALFACAIIATNGYRLLFPALHEILDTAFALLVLLNVLVGIAFIIGQKKSEKPTDLRARELAIREQLTASLQKTAEAALPAPTLAADEIHLFASANEYESIANNVVMLATHCGGSAAKAPADDTGITVLAELPANREEEFRHALAPLVQADFSSPTPPKEKFPANGKVNIYVRISQASRSPNP